MKQTKTITVCTRCKIPLIWTFMWAYNEYFCINCNGHWGMMGAGDHVELTPELKKMDKIIKRVWKAMAFNLIPRSSYQRTTCKKCQTCTASHLTHLTKQEKRKNKLATAMLRKLRGAWD